MFGIVYFSIWEIILFWLYVHSFFENSSATFDLAKNVCQCSFDTMAEERSLFAHSEPLAIENIRELKQA